MRTCRHRAAPLVCRRWAKAAAAPALITRVDVCLSGPHALQRAAAFGAWLSAHGGGIRQLDVELAPERRQGGPGTHPLSVSARSVPALQLGDSVSLARSYREFFVPGPPLGAKWHVCHVLVVQALDFTKERC